MTDQSFFVGVNNPKEIRKDLILSARQMTQALVAYEKYKEIREEKVSLLQELKKTMDSVIYLNKKLRSHLPRVKTTPKAVPIKHEHMLDSERKAAAKKAVKKTTTKKTVKKQVPQPKSRLEQLRAELDRYDAKLSKLE